jgi:drug/metabolite transporter (DMT)-like permease
MLVTLLIPVSALLLGRLLLGETIDPRQLAGMALIGLGLAAIDGRPLSLLRHRLTSRPAPL